MNLREPLFPGKLLRRYKRFFADIELPSGEIITAHCANSGSMKGLSQEGAEVLLSDSANPKRKLRFTWELIKVDQTWVCVNTLVPNRLMKQALIGRQIAELSQYDQVKPEAKWGEGVRFDFFLESAGLPACFVEVKSVTLSEGELALFPDAVTARGAKHLTELIEVVRQGMRGVIFFLVNRNDCQEFAPAQEIDPHYAAMLRAALDAGVEALVYRAHIQPPEINIDCKILFAANWRSYEKRRRSSNFP